MNARRHGGRLGFAAALLALCLAAPAGAEFLPQWSGETFEPLSPLDPPWILNPIISRRNLPIHTAADPFLYRHGGLWWLFFEKMTTPADRGVIALASSFDGIHWSHEGVILDTEDQLSYPLVFLWNGQFYLTPDRYPTPGLAIYRCEEETFPWGWEPVAEILTDRVLGDATLFRQGDLWWLLASNSGSGTLYLWYADELLDPDAWTEHPLSPLVVDDRSRARPAGRVLRLAGDRLIRLAQRSSEVYGQGVRAFEILALDTEQYLECELPESPILGSGASEWNGERMHHLDAWWTGDRWLCAVDGYDGVGWSVGIFSDELKPSAAAWKNGAENLRLTARPGGEPRMIYHLPVEGRVTLTIHDVAGRRLRVLREGLRLRGRHESIWDGRDERGRPLPSGLYPVRLHAGGDRADAKLLLLR